MCKYCLRVFKFGCKTLSWLNKQVGSSSHTLFGYQGLEKKEQYTARVFKDSIFHLETFNGQINVLHKNWIVNLLHSSDFYIIPMQ